MFRALPPGHCSQCGFLYDSPFSKRSYFGRQVFLESTTRSRPLAARGGTMREKWWPKGAWDMHPGFFYMPQICDMGPIILLPFRRKACWGFLSPFKNPTASAGFERANLGIRGQHATSETPKPLRHKNNKYTCPIRNRKEEGATGFYNTQVPTLLQSTPAEILLAEDYNFVLSHAHSYGQGNYSRTFEKLVRDFSLHDAHNIPPQGQTTHTSPLPAHRDWTGYSTQNTWGRSNIE